MVTLTSSYQDARRLLAHGSVGEFMAVCFAADGKIDNRAMADANWLSHLEQLVACKTCGRTFNPDRVEVHEKSCKGQMRRFQDVKVEIFH